MIAGPLLILFWGIVALIGAVAGLAFILGMKGAS